MRPKSFVAFIGFVLLAAGTYCPLLRPFGLVHWDLFELSRPYGLVLLLIAVAGIITIVLDQRRAARPIAWLALALVVILYAGTLLKIHNAFKFIPFRGLSGYLTWQIQLTWGWLVLFSGAALAALTTSLGKKPMY